MKLGITLLLVFSSACASTPHPTPKPLEARPPLEVRKQACIKDPKLCNKLKLSELALPSESAVLVQNLCLFQKRSEACLEAGNRYFNQNNTDKATRFYRLGCDLKDQSSCKNLADANIGIAEKTDDQEGNPEPSEDFVFKVEHAVSDAVHENSYFQRGKDPKEGGQHFSLFKAKQSAEAGFINTFQLEPSKLVPIQNDCGGADLYSDPRNPIFFLTGDRFKSGRITGEESKLVLNQGDTKSLSFQSQVMEIRYLKSGKIEISASGKSQTILELRKPTSLNVRFIGDLDRDGKMDLILSMDYDTIDTSHGGESHDTQHATFLFLSSPAREDEILRPGAYDTYGDYASDDC